MLNVELWIRLGFFAGVLLIMMCWEWRAPRRPQHDTRGQRWPRNLLLLVINTLILHWFFPLAAIGAALVADELGWGVFNLWPVPLWLSVVVSLLALDLLIYLQHRLLHALPLLWRLHRVHHTDLELDVTTGLRFHPLEILLSMLFKLAAVTLLGAPPLAVLLFEVLLNATAMFNHANVHLPKRLDAVLRLILVTPDMHRVHHSVIPAETDSNFGFNLPWWDRLFGTYRPQPKAGHLGMTIGLTQFRTRAEQRLYQLLIQPFRRQ